jgi:hypothetical protein
MQADGRLEAMSAQVKKLLLDLLSVSFQPKIQNSKLKTVHLVFL